MRVDVVKSRSSVRRGCDELLSSIVKAHVQGFIAVTGEGAYTLAWMEAELVTRGAGLVIGVGLFWEEPVSGQAGLLTRWACCGCRRGLL